MRTYSEFYYPLIKFASRTLRDTTLRNEEVEQARSLNH